MREEFVRQIEFYLAESHRKIVAVWDSLTDDQIWLRPNEQTLAPANQLLHLSGNLRQWVGSALAGLPDKRERDAEFAARSGFEKSEVWQHYASAYALVVKSLQSPCDLGGKVRVQGHDTTVLGVWVHVTEHMSYHTGQLVFFAKQLQGKEFDFYAAWSLNDTADA